MLKNSTNINLSSSRIHDSNHDWSGSCQHTECTYHQISPYIGKLKSSIAKDLIEEYTNESDLIFEPFSGSGTIPLESVINNRNVIASDVSIYSKILTIGKLSVPNTKESALRQLSYLEKKTQMKQSPDLRKVPKWIRKFFHPLTLKETINFVDSCTESDKYFFLACVLGILHHQRPGFLSYPSSHLVPYLRDKKYSRKEFPELYAYRELFPRLEAKIERVYKRSEKILGSCNFRLSKIQNVNFRRELDCVITSPPYMNALDYFRDNRLRIWFLNKSKIYEKEENPNNIDNFSEAMTSLARKTNLNLKKGKYCVLIVGEKISKSNKHPSDKVCEIFDQFASKLKLKTVIKDEIPDIRRSRRDCERVKSENILVFQKKS